jgi:hypothetical protein
VVEMSDVVLRRELAPGDVDAIIDLHDRIYRAEYGASRAGSGTSASQSRTQFSAAGLAKARSAPSGL